MANVTFIIHHFKDHCGNAKIAGIRKRCRLNHAFEMWCIAFAAISQWTVVNEHLGGFLRRTFGGWHQTRINEKTNKVLRDSANRDNASKVEMKLTQNALSHHIILKYMISFAPRQCSKPLGTGITKHGIT